MRSHQTKPTAPSKPGHPSPANGPLTHQPGRPGTSPAPSTGGAGSPTTPHAAASPGAAPPVEGAAAAGTSVAENPAAPATPAAVPGAPAACADNSIGLIAQVGQPSFKVGERPLFRLVIANLGNTPCTRDLDPGLQELTVTGPNGARIWDSNDCSPQRRPDVRTLEPGKPLVFPVSWAGHTSSPGCAAERAPVGAGSYQLHGKLGTLSC
ncbi:MAG: hypothetical protein J2P19_25800, partial [Pseudonocardia sp.]|nr:hypothetical protein [Pseudonocardia sp.]